LAAAPFQGLQAEIHIAAQLLDILGQASVGVFGDIELATHAADLLLQFTDAGEELLCQFLRNAGATAGRRGYRCGGEAATTASRIKVAPQFQDLVLQGDAFTAVHLRQRWHGAEQWQGKEGGAERNAKGHGVAEGPARGRTPSPY